MKKLIKNPSWEEIAQQFGILVALIVCANIIISWQLITLLIIGILLPLI